MHPLSDEFVEKSFTWGKVSYQHSKNIYWNSMYTLINIIIRDVFFKCTMGWVRYMDPFGLYWCKSNWGHWEETWCPNRSSHYSVYIYALCPQHAHHVASCHVRERDSPRSVCRHADAVWMRVGILCWRVWRFQTILRANIFQDARESVEWVTRTPEHGR